jgi:Fe-Mn family superoxide dismutase
MNQSNRHDVAQGGVGPWPEQIPVALQVALSATFTSVENWDSAWRVAWLARGGQPGWMVLEFRADSGKLQIGWHGTADAPAQDPNRFPLLVQETWGRDAKTQFEHFLSHMAWDRIADRYRDAVYRASARIAASFDDVADSHLLDVRRRKALEQSGESIARATWFEPTLIDGWTHQVPRDRPVVTYCVAGHEVSRMAALRLRAVGVDARFLEGGFEGWKAHGGLVATV